ncbi:WavQ [Erwinia aphidicola]|uniref:WavQ n=1 Tax=Erwinia aphidicola TaxID=68334 RepID=UPI0030CB87AF
MNIFICAPSYFENSGGSLVLHRLCHLINQFDNCNAFLVKSQPKYSGEWGFKRALSQLKWYLINNSKFKTNPKWDTPVWKGGTFPENSVVVYPEIINGNPLKIKNVVRWFLHQPGFHTNVIDYSSGELYFKFNTAIDDFDRKGSILSKNELKVIYYPIEIYNTEGLKNNTRDINCCHMIRKGKDKTPVHDNDSVELDGLSHREVAEIFKRSKRFICYDDYTAYSIFAVLCGCESIVMPGLGRTLIDWYPQEKDRYGISYGLSEEQLDWAKNTSHKVLPHIINEHEYSNIKILKCLEEISAHFKLV